MKMIEELEKLKQYSKDTILKCCPCASGLIEQLIFISKFEQKVIDIERAIKAHCEFCEAHNACIDKGGFYCPETESILKAIGI